MKIKMRFPIFPPPIPKEHGAWGMLLTSYALGMAIAKEINMPAILTAFAVLNAFLLKQPIYLWLKRRSPAEISKARAWSIIYIVFAILFATPLIWSYHRWWLLPLGIVAFFSALFSAWLQRRRLARSIWGEFWAIVQITMTAPATFYSIRGELTSLTSLMWKMWGLLILYYAGSIFYVKLKVMQYSYRPTRWQKKLKLGWQNIAYQIVALSLVSFSVFEKFVPALVLIAFIPNSIKAFLGTFHVKESLRLKVIGWTEAGFSALYVILLAIALY